MPVAQDGTCNGFQHYSAIGRDSLGAQYVNVTPGPRPNDLYTSIMHLAESLIQKEKELEAARIEAERVAKLQKEQQQFQLQQQQQQHQAELAASAAQNPPVPPQSPQKRQHRIGKFRFGRRR